MLFKEAWFCLVLYIPGVLTIHYEYDFNGLNLCSLSFFLVKQARKQKWLFTYVFYFQSKMKKSFKFNQQRSLSTVLWSITDLFGNTDLSGSIMEHSHCPKGFGLFPHFDLNGRHLQFLLFQISFTYIRGFHPEKGCSMFRQHHKFTFLLFIRGRTLVFVCS